MLRQKRDIQSCYFAAQTIRNKIQNSFHELPEYSHGSLRESLMNHVCQITAETELVIVTQLCLALADLALLMTEWKTPVLELIKKLSLDDKTMYPLVVTLTFIPEELNSRYLRLGSNRRENLSLELESYSKPMTEFLTTSLQKYNDISIMVLNIIKCYSAWISIQAIDIPELSSNAIFDKAFSLLSSNDTETKLHDASADCICTTLEVVEGNLGAIQLEISLFNSVLKLENVYHAAVAQEDVEKAMNFCRMFTTLSESFVESYVGYSHLDGTHFSIATLDVVLTCITHYDFEVMEITFHLWYRVSEEIYRRNDEELFIIFQPYIETLIGAMYRHSQMDNDHDGLIDDADIFAVNRI